MKSLKYSKELDRFFELLNTEAEPGKTVRWELSGEVPEIVKLEKKLTKEEARIFKVTPFYDVEKPFRVSGVLLKGVPSIVTTIHTQGKATTIKSNLEALKSDISSLIHKIDTIDSEPLPYLEDAVYESIKTVEPVKRGELIMRIKGIFYLYRNHVKPNKEVEMLSNDFNIPAGALGNLESLSTKFYTQRDELVKQVREKVGTYHSYLKALKEWDIIQEDKKKEKSVNEFYKNLKKQKQENQDKRDLVYSMARDIIGESLIADYFSPKGWPLSDLYSPIGRRTKLPQSTIKDWLKKALEHDEKPDNKTKLLTGS